MSVRRNRLSTYFKAVVIAREGIRSHEFIGLRPLEDNVRSFIPSNVLLHVCQVIGLKHMYTK